MHRILFQIGPMTIYSYGLLMAIAFIVSTVFILSDAKKEGIDTGKMMDVMVIIILSGILGGRLLFVAQNLGHYTRNPLQIFMLNEGGLAFQGAFLGALIGGIIASKKKRIHFWKGADVIAPYVALGQGIGRIGCFLNGCCYGKFAEKGIKFVFPQETLARVPAQLYSSLTLFGLFAVLVLLKRKKMFDGYIFSMYMMLYGVLRFFLEFIRADNPAVLFDLKLSQIIGIATFFAGALTYNSLKVKRFKG
ncbi:MAG: prolipoprotein diacylglyceryl transferase [Candidatus Omnitrophota bacterium]